MAKTIFEKLKGNQQEREDALKNLTQEEAREILVKRLKWPNLADFNFREEIFGAAIEKATEVGQPEKTEAKQSTSKTKSSSKSDEPEKKSTTAKE